MIGQQQASQSNWNANQLMVMEIQRQKTIFIPAFLTFTLINFNTLSINDLVAEVNGILHIYFDFGILPEQVINFIVNKFRLHFFMENSIVINHEKKGINLKIKNKGPGLKQYMISKFFSARIQPYIFFTPFEFLDLRISVELPEHLSKSFQGIKYNFVFNLMDIADKDQNEENQQNKARMKQQKRKRSEAQNRSNEKPKKKLMYSESDAIGAFDLSEAKLCVEYTWNPLAKPIRLIKPDPGCIGTLVKWYFESYYKKRDAKNLKKHQRRNKKNDQSARDLAQDYEQTPINQEIRVFRFAHFHLPISKFHFASTASFFPLWMLGIINVSVYHAETSIEDRVGVIAFIALGYVEIMLFFRDQIPSTPILTFLQLTLYANFASVILLLANTLDIYLEDQHVINGTYYVSIIILLFTILAPAIVYLYTRVYLKPSYDTTDMQDIKNETYKELKLDYNDEANKYFQDVATKRNFICKGNPNYEDRLQELVKELSLKDWSKEQKLEIEVDEDED